MLNRRFIRIKALQNLYAFYVSRAAHHNTAIKQIQEGTITDISIAPIHNNHTPFNKNEAIHLFEGYLNNKTATALSQHEYDEYTKNKLAQTASHYKNQVARDFIKVKNSLTEESDKIYNTYLCLLHVLIEWFLIAQKQQAAATPALQYKTTIADLQSLPYNHILQRLAENEPFSNLIQKIAGVWQLKTQNIKHWYNTFLKEDVLLQHYLLDTQKSLNKDRKILYHVVKNIIFKHKIIQDFFSDLDLRWLENQYLVEDMLMKTIKSVKKNKAQSSDIQWTSLCENWEADQQFYQGIIEKTIENDGMYATLIEEKLQNWSIKRLMLLDKVILKLALCGIMHWENIPAKVSMNEYIDIAKAYGTPKSSQFINGLLDAIYKDVLSKKSLKTISIQNKI